MSTKEIIQLVNHFNIAVASHSLYSENHKILVELSEKCLTLLENLLEENEVIKILRIGNELIINNEPLTVDNVHIKSFIRRLNRRGLERIDVKRGITIEEIQGLIHDLTKNNKGPLKEFPHITSGRVEVRLGAVGKGEMDRDNGENPMPSDHQMDRIKDVFEKARYFNPLDVTGLEDVVMDFFNLFVKEGRILNALIPFKVHSEYSYIHATNVSILSMFLAESLGFSGKILYDVGVSALLHDVGKMHVSKEVLYKKDKLDDKEWEEMKKHPIYGVKYLLSISNVPQLAPIVAFEHHMKFDGTGYPERSRHNERQHIISQIVTISDFFDAARANRPWSQGLPEEKIFEIMQKLSNREFNPPLLNHFIRKLSIV